MSEHMIQSFAANVLRLGNEVRELADENARLKAEVERLTLENSQYEEHHKYGQNVITSLREEVERLTQLNDTLALRYDATNSMLDGCAKEIEEMEAEVERLTAFTTRTIIPNEELQAQVEELQNRCDFLEGRQS